MRYKLLILFTFILLQTDAFAQTRGISAGEVVFGKPIRITGAIQKKLDSLSAYMLYNPLVKIVVTSSGNSSKLTQQSSWDNTNAVIEYLGEKHGISRDRFIFQYGQSGMTGSVTFRVAQKGEEGPSNVPPPFPNLRRN